MGTLGRSRPGLSSVRGTVDDGCLCQPELIVTGAALRSAKADAWRELTLWRKVRRTVIAERELGVKIIGLGSLSSNFAYLMEI